MQLLNIEAERMIDIATQGPVAQRIRHLTTNQGIAGSSPAKVNIFGQLTKTAGVTKIVRPRVGSNHQPFG